MFCSASIIICGRTVFVFEGSCDFSLLEVTTLITSERVLEKRKLNISMQTELRTEKEGKQHVCFKNSAVEKQILTIKSRLNDQIHIMII